MGVDRSELWQSSKFSDMELEIRAFKEQGLTIIKRMPAHRSLLGASPYLDSQVCCSCCRLICWLVHCTACHNYTIEHSVVSVPVISSAVGALDPQHKHKQHQQAQEEAMPQPGRLHRV